MAGITKFILVTFFLIVAMNQVSADTYTHVCSNTNGPVYTCTTDTVPASEGAHKCCASVSYSSRHPLSGGEKIFTCCHKSTAHLQTGHCTNQYARHHCHQTEKYCCPSQTYFFGSMHYGCCSFDPATSCLNRKTLFYCLASKPHCCPVSTGYRKCNSYSSTCCRATEQECGGSNVQGNRNNVLLLSMIGIATVVIFVSMAIAPLPLMNFK